MHEQGLLTGRCHCKMIRLSHFTGEPLTANIFRFFSSGVFIYPDKRSSTLLPRKYKLGCSSLKEERENVAGLPHHSTCRLHCFCPPLFTVVLHNQSHSVHPLCPRPSAPLCKAEERHGGQDEQMRMHVTASKASKTDLLHLNFQPYFQRYLNPSISKVL